MVEEIDARVDARFERRIEQVEMERYQSPFPHPEHLERYERLYPGAARVIFTSFEEQGEHRRELERQFTRGNERRASIGQWLAFSLVLISLGLGGLCIAIGEAGAGAGIVGVAFTGGVVLYIAGGGARGRAPARNTGPTSRDKARATRGTELESTTDAQP